MTCIEFKVNTVVFLRFLPEKIIEFDKDINIPTPLSVLFTLTIKEAEPSVISLSLIRLADSDRNGYRGSVQLLSRCITVLPKACLRDLSGRFDLPVLRKECKWSTTRDQGENHVLFQGWMAIHVSVASITIKWITFDFTYPRQILQRT